MKRPSDLPFRSRPRCAARRGSVLIYAMMVLIVVAVMGLGLAALTTHSVRQTRAQQNASTAFNVAESGAERALRSLKDAGAPPPGIAPFDPFGGRVVLGAASYQVTIDPDDQNPATDRKRFVIRSQGISLDRQETVELVVQSASFGRYAYFTDYETTPGGARIFFRAGDVLDGPVHSNSTNGTDFQVNWNGSTAPIFRGHVTTAAQEIDYTPGRPTSEAEFGKIFKDGSRGFSLGVDRIELPDSTDLQKFAAWGNTADFPTTPGVHINAAGSSPLGGIHLAGDSALHFSVTPEGWQKITVTQGGMTTTITIQRDQNQMLVESGGTTTTYRGTTNGVIYCSGNITSLDGTLADSVMSGSTLIQRNAFTIATDVRNDKDVTITGNLTYQTPPDSSRPWDDPANLRSAALGVVSRNINLSTSCPTELTVHGVMMAGGRNTSEGSFTAEDYASRPTGTLNLVGGVIQKFRGPVGTFNPNGGGGTGFRKNYAYDQRMALMPPPFFPTTGGYERISFMRTAAGPY